MSSTDFSLDWFSLEGKNALVTGGNGGLGQGLSMGLARAGANIMISSLDAPTGAMQTQIEALGRRYHRTQADISQPLVTDEVVRECVETLGSIDILVNCAGISRLAEFDAFSREKWDSMVAVNLSAPFHLSQSAARAMKPQGHGKIINICSLFSFLGGRGSPAYAATKHGIAGLTRTCCDELAEHNIQVNGIAPGYFKTPLTAATFSDPDKTAAIVNRIPAGRLGTPADLMGAVVFLASPASNYVNGHLLTVDGGYLVR